MRALRDSLLEKRPRARYTRSMSGVAYRVETKRLVIRCWNPAEDAPLLKDAVDSSLAHLRPWMPWSWGEPTTLPEKVALLRGYRGKFDLGREYIYGVFPPDESRVIGGCGLHVRGDDDARELGYWISAQDIGQGYATELSAALTKVAFAISEVKRVEIWTAVANERSARVPAKLGFTDEGVLRQRRQVRPGVDGDVHLWTLLADEYARSPASAAVVRALDVSGEVLLG